MMSTTFGDITRKVKVGIPSFDGQLDPKAFTDWLVDIEQYFDWYGHI